MIKNMSAIVVPSRIGRHLKTPVPLLPFGDTTVLNRTLGAYRAAGFDEIIVVLSYRAADLEASLGADAAAYQVVTSPNPEEEYPGLIRRALERLSPSAKSFALGLGDQPLLDGDLLQGLAQRFVAANRPILVPVWQGHLGHPVFFAASLAEELKQLKPNQDPWDVIKAHAADVHDHHVYHTSVVRHIEDTEDYHDLLTIAGLPIPQTEPLAGADGDGASPEMATSEPAAASAARPGSATGMSASSPAAGAGPDRGSMEQSHQTLQGSGPSSASDGPAAGHAGDRPAGGKDGTS